MAEFEFTGERVIPGRVDPDLFNEHLARYRFAAWFLSTAPNARILDAACGAGYGARELQTRGRIVSADISAEATSLARTASAAVVQASCEALPFADASFEAITAFEMIEHLQHAPAFLSAARRLLRPEGVLLISTPNRAYYAEARGTAGPNPFHTREYDHAEFTALLKDAFPHVYVWTQNHAAGIVFAPAKAIGGMLDAAPSADPQTSHFFLAACSTQPLDAQRLFAWIPDSGNILRERERHIARLEAELRDKDRWLTDLHATHAALQQAHAQTEADLRARNLWAESLNQELADSRSIVQGLQADVADKLVWVARLQSDLQTSNQEITRLQQELAALNQTLTERTAWARSLEGEKNLAIAAYRELEASAEQQLTEARAALHTAHQNHAHHLRLIAASRWVRLGRRLNIGPEIG